MITDIQPFHDVEDPSRFKSFLSHDFTLHFNSLLQTRALIQLTESIQRSSWRRSWMSGVRIQDGRYDMLHVALLVMLFRCGMLSSIVAASEIDFTPAVLVPSYSSLTESDPFFGSRSLWRCRTTTTCTEIDTCIGFSATSERPNRSSDLTPSRRCSLQGRPKHRAISSLIIFPACRVLHAVCLHSVRDYQGAAHHEHAPHNAVRPTLILRARTRPAKLLPILPGRRKSVLLCSEIHC